MRNSLIPPITSWARTDARLPNGEIRITFTPPPGTPPMSQADLDGILQAISRLNLPGSVPPPGDWIVCCHHPASDRIIVHWLSTHNDPIDPDLIKRSPRLENAPAEDLRKFLKEAGS
jgi:hypothetical protein